MLPSPLERKEMPTSFFYFFFFFFYFFYFLTDLILPDQSTAPTVGTAPSSVSEEQNKDGKNTEEKESSCQLHHGRAAQKGKGSYGAVQCYGNISILWAHNTVHNSRIDKREQRWRSMVWFNTTNALFSPFTLLFHICWFFAFYKDLELDLPNNKQGPWGVCCYPWTAHHGLKSELCWEGRKPR